ncbi:selenium metabolism-associated LysR family transcriptional regulator [Acetonema longum]|uniref:Transcriptional regulator, lysr family protein n=1 Tax=Acetonema longum DSM 6540 TaxID=1009370 RepID=F7NEE0_9FIRM|nr:selenium metabolism-associated LysR family transcriptional regulator [Acetonema longum]EGO65652.1 transcriptional regulator, lysr family protein [Acetonema longum DSM 6540]
MLDIQLQIFKTVVEKKSFSLAAQELHMAQSSVSQQVQNLEKYYGVKLFDRIQRRIYPTEAGLRLYPYANELERLYHEARQTITGLTDTVDGKLHIGASLTIGEYLMPRMLVRFSQQYPQVEVSMDVGNTEHVTSMVIAGGVDIGFVEGPFNSAGVVRCQPFYGDELVVIAAVSYPELQDENVTVTLPGIFNERWVLRESDSGTRKVFEQFIQICGYGSNSLRIVMELGSTQAVKEAVKAGVGITAVSRLAVEQEIQRGEVRIIPLQEGPVERAFAMISHKEKFKTRVVDRFMKFFTETMRMPGASGRCGDGE